MLRNGFRMLFAVLAVAAVFAVAVDDADARARFSAGSRGMRTFRAPAPTATAPRTTRPIERTMTQPASTVGRGTATSSATGGLFNRPGLLGGLAAGFLGAGLFGMLFGHGLFGGLGGFASVLGLLLQLIVVVFVARLIWNWWQQRSQPAFAGGASLRRVLDDGRPERPGTSGIGGAAPAEDVPLEIAAEDFNSFERLLGEVQSAYGAEDLAALRTRVTPEMLSYLAEELARNSSHGVVNQISEVKLLQGDLSEAWSEGDEQYATVAMRYALNDRIAERATGKVVEQSPSEATELWTFRRSNGGNWVVSAIQQTD